MHRNSVVDARTFAGLFGLVLLLVACGTVAAGCAGVSVSAGTRIGAFPDDDPPQTAPGPPGQPQPMDEIEPPDAAPADAAHLERLLERAVDRAHWRHLEIFSECIDARGAFRSVRIFGDGVVIRNERSQYEIPREKLVEILDGFRATGFPGMRELYGREMEEPSPDDSRDDGGAATRIICRVILELDGASKQVVQTARGAQSEELRSLEEAIYAGSAPPPGEEPMEIGGLDEGLEALASGRLAPQALHLIFNRKPESGARSGEGLLLEIEGRRATVTPFDVTSGYGEAFGLELGHEALAEVASLLRDNRVGGLPVNLYAADYNDLVIELLGRDVRLQARQFANKTATTHGEDQRRFDRIRAGLSALARKVLREGRQGET